MKKSLTLAACAAISCAAFMAPCVALAQAQSINPYLQGAWSGTNWPQTYSSGILETTASVKVHTDCGALGISGDACMSKIKSDVYQAASDACTYLTTGTTEEATKLRTINRWYHHRLSDWIRQCAAKSYADAMLRIVIKNN